ncbi:hypothetical protein HY995_00740 [Candidatus Micrarchaeota archaeon]|nr:hypothetical protein [Candidatus Micrarchaeota archaeon]
MASEDRKAVRKDDRDAAKDAPKSLPAPAPASDKVAITLPTLTFETGPNFTFKLGVLAILLIVFAASLFIFTRANFATSDVFDIQRLQYNIDKVWGINFILFGVLFSLCLALAAYFGFEIPKAQSALPLIALFVVAVIFSFVFPPYAYAFIGFAVSLGSCSIFASLSKELGLAGSWRIIGHALTVLLVIAFIFAFMKVNAQKAYYTDFFLSSVAAYVPDVSASVAPAAASSALNFCASAIESSKINEDNVKGAINKDEFSAQITASAGSSFDSVPPSQKQAIIDSFYDASVSRATTIANLLKNDLAKELRKVNTAQYVASANLTSVITPLMLKTQFNSIPALKAALDYIPALVALTVLSIVSIFNFFVRIFASVLSWLLAKYVLS